MHDPIDNSLEPDILKPFDPAVEARLADAAKAAMEVLNQEGDESPTLIIMLSVNNGGVMMTSSIEEAGIADVLEATLETVRKATSH